jgi:Tfp pilus tip-associated adhesin PilY1
MVRDRRSSLGRAAVVALIAAAALFVANRPGHTDDIDLLRFTTAKPYVFFILDNSASMTLAPDGTWVHANGDDPRSKLYQAKRVIYDVFKDVDDIHFGFAAFNQDNTAVKSKHWLYYYTSTGSGAKLPGSWPIAYPRPDDDGPVQIAADGTVTSDVEGDVLTFGKHMDATGVAGSCASPLSLSTTADYEKVNRYSKLDSTGNGTTVIWLSKGGKTYRLTVDRPATKPDTTVNPQLGQDKMNVRLTLDEIKNNTCAPIVIQQTSQATIELTLWTSFVMVDEDNGLSPSGSGKASGVDDVGGLWDYKDLTDAAVCGSEHPFSGIGWEGNYDGTYSGGLPSGTSINPQDVYCKTSGVGSTCTDIKETTVFDPLGRALDRGDMIPLDWRVDNKQAFLGKMAPNQSVGTPDFGIASYFENTADSNTGALPLVDPGESPLFGSGASPLSKAVVDFRCWYLGDDPKCKNGAYDPSWESIAQQRDSEWGCRRPYLIVISDGGDSCSGENPCADTASLNSKSGIKTWVIAYGADCAHAGNPLKCMAQNGKGELVCPQDSSQLKTELQNILGQIREESRAFASAAVPSVQAVVEDKIFLTNFTPLNGKPVWDGHVHSFLKPLPLRAIDQKPDTTSPNHLWDAGQVIRDTQVNTTDPLGPAANQRRVYYAREATTSNVPDTRRLFEPTSTSDANAVRYDLWNGMGISFTAGNTSSESAAETRANAAIATTFSIKSHVLTVKDPVTGAITTQTIRYILGDVFHSNPLVMGSPPTTQYYATNLHNYQAFAAKHALRRKMLLVGANDGMVHAFDAGLYQTSTKKFDNGTGKEVFAFIPRNVLRSVKIMADPSTSNHQWGVDGTIQVADVFIDPLHNGTPTVADREWRTVAVGGLREGGIGYYALDLTQPDVLNTTTQGQVPVPDNGYVPSCLAEGSALPASCGPVPFPTALWEFDDTVLDVSATQVPLDEDNNGTRDLAIGWSIPNLGRIRLATSSGTGTEDHYVAVFGGGFDPDNKGNPQTGTWIYMVDIETGKAIYKRQVRGAVPSEPAAVDTDGDGYLDRLYFGTTAGSLYRVDLTADVTSGSDKIYPALANKSVLGADGNTYTVQRIPDTSWVPREIFNANFDGLTATATPRPIFFRPSVLFDAKLGSYILAFGAGDRDDLWNADNLTGRFYVFLDQTKAGDPVLTENNLQRVTVTGPRPSSCIEGGALGWYLVLDTNEKVINDAFALAGVTFFSTFEPVVTVSGGKDPLCSKTGNSRIFIVSTLCADAFVQPPSGTTTPVTRSFSVPNFVTNPFAEQAQTKNASGGVTEICDDPTKLAIMESMKSLFPANCKYSNFRVDIKTIAADTSLVCIAPVPVCLIEKNWKEF